MLRIASLSFEKRPWLGQDARRLKRGARRVRWPFALALTFPRR
jgi:hypothetical protein